MKNFLKSIVVGFGAVSPGLSGSVLMVIFGLYEKVVDAVGNVFKNFKKNVLFLIPIVAGCAIGALSFSKLIDFLLNTFPLQTRFAFLGLVLGTLPLFNKEVRKNGFSKKYYLVILASAAVGLCLLLLGDSLFPSVENPSFFQSVMIGFAVAASSIIPGVDSAVILSAFGIYDIYISSLANFNLQILLPAAIGLGVGVLSLSFLMSVLLKKFYTLTFSVIFGFFISVIPSVLNEECVIGLNLASVIAFVMLFLGFCFSFYLSDIQKNNERIKRLLSKLSKKKIERG